MRAARGSIFLIVTMLVSVGIVMIYSASSIYAYSSMNDSLYFLKKHLIYLAIGLVLMFTAMSIDINRLKSLSKPIILASIFLLLLVLIPHIGREAAGARRWFRIGVINFQPSEFAKIAVIIYMAELISRKGTLMKSFVHGFLPAIIALGAITGLVLLEPDLGTAITISAIAIIMMFAGSVRIRHILALIL
ncbi:MAG: FtsW/RodA/SpoVE family cell cycle protein, partial [Candidatus Omnitrophota bacterium]|nr:FtsW/RodA/SpoVE family cell cycle protein [Candidatus Omnitrophota bacterium]